jgi:hypothetical protein
MSVFSCKKENTTTAVNNTSTQNSLAPVANAGADQTVNIISCYVGRTVELDGSASLNDNTGLLEFSWAKVSGPFCNISSMGTNSPKAEVTQLSAGQYAFELTVTGQPTASSKGLSARDTMLVTVTGTTAATEYNLDVTFNNAFQFSRNVERCYTWYMGPLICLYWDLTNVNGSFSLPTLGEVIFSAYEQADTTSSGVYTNTQMSFSCAGCVPSEYAEGTSSINFKQLIRQGGGPFNGILQIQNGSAKNNCDSHVFDNVDPLVISGNMDTAAHTINLSIKGKVFF